MKVTPHGNETLDFTPGNLPDDILRALGLLVSSSAQTESVIETAIAGMVGIDGEMGWAITTHMSAPLRTSVLKSAAEIRIDDSKALDHLDAILERIRLLQAVRNDMVHGSWAVRPSNGEILLTNLEARTHVQADLQPVTVNDIKVEADAIYEAGMELMRFLMALNLLPDLPKERVRGVNTPKARKARRKKTIQ